MKLSKSCLATMGILFGGAFTSGSALASDGSIAFSGAITAATCTVTLELVNASGSVIGTAGGAINLPTISVAALNNAGAGAASAAPAGFRLKTSSCNAGNTGGTTANTANVGVYFEPGPNVTIDGYIANGFAGTASDPAAGNVVLELLGSNFVRIPLGQSPTATGAADGNGMKALTDNPNFTYYTRYRALKDTTGNSAAGTVTAGQFNAAVTYSLVYN